MVRSKVASHICHSQPFSLSLSLSLSGGDPSLRDDISDLTELSQEQIDHLLKDTNEISKLLRKWQSQQTEEAASAPWSTEDKLRKRISDLIETEADYVRVSLHAWHSKVLVFA